MEISLTTTEFRRLLDLVYIGNWILNSYRGEDAIVDFTQVQSLLFQKAKEIGMESLTEELSGSFFPSEAFVEGGIHAPIAHYEDMSFYHLLAEELAFRDFDQELTPYNYPHFLRILDSYFQEFEHFGTQRLVIDEKFIF